MSNQSADTPAGDARLPGPLPAPSQPKNIAGSVPEIGTATTLPAPGSSGASSAVPTPAATAPIPKGNITDSGSGAVSATTGGVVVTKGGTRRPSTPELTVGMILADRYEVLERLSAGGMGVVYKARHIALDDLVALKVLLKPQREEDQKRFLLEARVATKIKHPNTVYISDFGVIPDGRSYLAMEFLQGRTLAQAISKLQGPEESAPPVGMDPLRACRIAIQIARGLQAVHDKGIVHREVRLVYRKGLRIKEKPPQRLRPPPWHVQRRQKPYIPSLDRRK